MEVILSTAEYKPGDFVARHIHHGVEAFYVVQGATVELPDGKQIKLATGTGSINLREPLFRTRQNAAMRPLRTGRYLRLAKVTSTRWQRRAIFLIGRFSAMGFAGNWGFGTDFLANSNWGFPRI